MPAVIFDMDGVLVDSYAAHFESWRQIAAEHGVVMTLDQFAHTFGRTSREIIVQLWGPDRFSVAEANEIDRRKEAAYRDLVDAAFPAMDGAADLVRALADAGFQLAVGSSGPPENVELCVRQLGIAEFVPVRITGRDVQRGKPDPQVFRLAAERLGVPPAECAVVEDAPVGVEAARRAGMTPIGLASTGRTPDQLAAAALVVASLRELTPNRIARLIADD